MKIVAIWLIAALLAACGPVLAIEGRAYKMREDVGTEPLYDCTLNYFYYIPCPTYSWFYAFGGFVDPWEQGTTVGAWFEIGDLSTGGSDICDPTQCHTLRRIRVLDFEGVQGYPAAWRCRIDVYCCDEYGCPVGPSLWSHPIWTSFGWNYILIDPWIDICLSGCATDPGPPASSPRLLITMTHAVLPPFGHENYNAWGTDVISKNLENGCVMHDYGCLPASYPRPYAGNYSTMHSGYYGTDFEHCPPQWFKDPHDSTPDGDEYGFVELCWRIYLDCSGPTATQPATWGSIKSMYK